MSHMFSPANHIRVFSSTTQAIASTTAPQIVTYDTVADYSGITCINGDAAKLSRFTIQQKGDYAISFFAEADCTGGTHNLHMWLRKNGADVASTCMTTTIGTAAAPVAASRTFVVDAVPGDYFEVWMAGDNTAIQLTAIAASAVNPVRPAAPSVVVNIHMVGAES